MTITAKWIKEKKNIDFSFILQSYTSRAKLSQLFMWISTYKTANANNRVSVKKNKKES